MTWLFLGLGSLAITLVSLVYFDSSQRAPFIIEKLPLREESFYLAILRIHVLSAALALPLCLILTSSRVIQRWPRFHRWAGRFAGLDILGALVPTGFYLAFFAKGGWAGTLGFLLTGGIVFWSMLQAIRWARAKRFARHRLYTFHVLGQLSVAVTSRTMLFLLGPSNLDPDLAYVLSLWIPVLGTFALVQYLASPPRPQPKSRKLYAPVLDAAGSAGGNTLAVQRQTPA